MDADYSKPETVEKALDEWANVFKQLPRIDAVFVPGGDPGHTDPAVLLPFLEKQTANLHRYHPQAQMWVSPQSFDQQWLDSFFDYLNDEAADLAERRGLRSAGSHFASRNAGGHSEEVPDPPLPRHHAQPIQCQFPVPDWDTRVRRHRRARGDQPAAAGRGRRSFAAGRPSRSASSVIPRAATTTSTSSSGAGWAGIPDHARGRHPAANTAATSSATQLADDFAQGLLALEQNWRGPLVTNRGVLTTLAAVPARWKNPLRRRPWRTGGFSRRSTARITTPSSTIV